MARIGLLIGSLLLALLLGVWALQVPSPRGPDAPATAFSAGRAMADVGVMGERPHPVGSADHARVRDHLRARMTALGLSPEVQTGPLSPGSVERLGRWSGAPVPPGVGVQNLVGVLPGRDRAQPAVLIMAHYDSAWDSPGAADDAAGVASILEAVRALKARGGAERDLVVLITDAEELGLDGARVFFGGHPLRDRIGAVVNLEARGGGGRAMMFETGRGNTPTIDLFARAGLRADGGVTSNALAVFVYALMPNGTDFTVARDRGLQGLNLAFIGRPAQYHSPASTPGALDQGALQHLGSQALEATDALLRARTLPGPEEDKVYADLFGRVIVGHPPAWGWGLWLGAVALAGVAAWRVRRAGRLEAADVGRGVLSGLWFVALGLVLTQAIRVLAGPVAGRGFSPEAYYTLLRRLPWMEAGAALAVLAAALLLLGGREAAGRRVLAGVTAAAALLALGLGRFSPVILGAAVIALALGGFRVSAPRSAWGGWLGLIALILLVGAVAQGAAPGAAFLFVWIGLLAALAAAIAAFVDPRLQRPAALIAPAVALILGGGWLVTLAHPTFLGVGMDLPGVLALIALLMLSLARPLAPQGRPRAMAIAATLSLALACGVSLYARVAEPAPPPAAGGPT